MTVEDVRELLEECEQRGVELRVVGEEVKVRCLKPAVTPEIRERLSAMREEIITYLPSLSHSGADAIPADAERAWELAIKAVAMEWQAVRAWFGGEAPWFDDEELQEALGDAMRCGDRDEALRLIEEWWNAWRDCIDDFLERQAPEYRSTRIRAERASTKELACWIDDEQTPGRDGAIFDLEVRVRAIWLFQPVERPTRRSRRTARSRGL